jgi:hypothetical protein
MFRRSSHRRNGRWLVLSASLFVAAACSSATDTNEGSPSPTGPASTSTPSGSADPVKRTIDGEVMGVGHYPAFTLDVPATFSANGVFVTKGLQGVSVWDVSEVPGDPCHWQSTRSDPGPTVDDLVDALTSQRHRHASEPTDVTLGGYRGRSLQWSVPADWVVTGDADFEGCDVEPSNGHRDFVSWFGNGEGERYQQVAGQVDMLWVLDVEGQRLLIDATYPPDTPGSDRAQLRTIVESIRFTDQAA